jgi:hypothetical protein
VTENESYVPIEYLRECLEAGVDGSLTWKVRPRSHFPSARGHSTWNAKYPGTQAGIAKKGYKTLRLTPGGRRLQLQAHRVIWALVHGKWPDQHIDHINRNRSDNRPENLRDVSPDVNQRNNGNPLGTGLLGAYRSRDKFISQIVAPRRGTVYLGRFNTAEEANAAYLRAKAEFGEDHA